MGKVKSELFEQILGADDELVPMNVTSSLGKLMQSGKRIVHNAKVLAEIEECDLPHNSVERYEFMQSKLQEMIK